MMVRAALRALVPSSLAHALFLLPLVGFAIITPYLVVSPIYPDETQWKLVSSRLGLDGSQLIYMFPECRKGYLLDVPISWYPLRWLDTLLYMDMTDPQRLRYWAYGIFLGIVGYAAWVAKRTCGCAAPAASVLGLVVAPLALGVLPFLLVFNRPEQMIVVSALIGCTLPVVLPNVATERTSAWLWAAAYVLLAWFLAAAHVKGLFFLPVLVLSAFFLIRAWPARIVLLGACALSAIETYRVWAARTDCPESPFLTQVFRSLSLSPADLANGPGRFFTLVYQNIRASSQYWKRVGFQADYQSDWLPTASSPLSILEVAVNAMLPALVGLAIVIVAIGLVSAARVFVSTDPDRFRRLGQDHRGAIIAAALVLTLIAVAGFQSNKNFYEAGLQAPLLGLSVLLALPSVLRSSSPRTLTVGTIVAAVVALSAGASELALALRFSENMPGWVQALSARETRQADLRTVIGRCGVPSDQSGRRIVMSDFAYTLLWRTREPILLSYAYGWWATGIDSEKVLHDRNATAIVASCHGFPAEHAPQVRGQEFCCTKLR